MGDVASVDATWWPQCSGVRGRGIQGKGLVVGLFQGEYYGDVEELDAARSAARTKCYGEDPCLLMLSFGTEICDTQLRVAAAHRVLRSHEGKWERPQRPKRGKEESRGEGRATDDPVVCTFLERGECPKHWHYVKVVTVLYRNKTYLGFIS